MGKTILISGGTGFIGKYLVKRLSKKENNLILLTRNIHNKRDTEFIKYVQWDLNSNNNIISYIEKADIIINLAGEPIAGKRWTPAQKEKLYKSRIDTSYNLIESIKKSGKKPRLYINASAIGYYGMDTEPPADENSPKGTGFLADLCEAWENENNKIREMNIRQVGIRIGIVLAKDGGALPKMALPYKLFLGGVIGPGNQWLSFIHIEDLINIFIYAIENEKLEGYFNAVSPQSVTMRELSKAIAKTLKRPNLFYIPQFILKLLLGESAIIVTGGKKVIPKKLIDLGFNFKYPNIYDALKEIYSK